MVCLTGFEEIGINTGWCLQTTTDGDIIRTLVICLVVVVITYLLSKKKGK